MSSGFVSSGSIEKSNQNDAEWRKAHRKLEENRQLKQDRNREGGGRSLFEALQANKAAEQEAFEESIRLKNQFRPLDEDEVEYLASLRDQEDEKERVKAKEEIALVAAFNKQRKIAETVSQATGSAADSQEWSAGARKRKRPTEREVPDRVKIRKASTSATHSKPSSSNLGINDSGKCPKIYVEERPGSQTTADLGLSAYSSEDE